MLGFYSCSKDDSPEDPDPITQPAPDPDPDPDPEGNEELAEINLLISNLSYDPESLLNVKDTGGAPSARTKTNEKNTNSEYIRNRRCSVFDSDNCQYKT